MTAIKLYLSLSGLGAALYILFWIGVIVAIVFTVLALWSIAKSLKEISIKISKQNAILANRQTTDNSAQSFRDTGTGAGQSSEPATDPEQ